LSPNNEYPLGRIVMGNCDCISDGLKSFLNSQEVQAPIYLDMDWLLVGHIDEIMSCLPGGVLAVASPARAIELLQDIPINDRATSVFFATGRKPVTGIVQAGGSMWKIKTSADHSGEDWGFVRIYEGAHAGVVARIIDIKPEFITVSNDVSVVEMPMYYYMQIGFQKMNNWTPNPGDKYVLCEGSKIWHHGSPAIITVKEILEDEKFMFLSTNIIPGKIKSDMNILSNYSGLTFKNIPVLFVRNEEPLDNEPLDEEDKFCKPFTPNAVNLQPVAGKLYIPRQFSPKDNTSQDIFEKEIKSVLGINVEFVDDWEQYHTRGGNVHCGSVVKRAPINNWWAKQPKKQP